jgi:hypothetical protein
VLDIVAPGGKFMRVFLAACLAIVILAVAGYFATSMAQRLSGTAYTTEGARIKHSWTYRRIANRVAPSGHGMAIPAGGSNVAEDCDVSTTLQWIMIDFGAGDAPSCS